MVDHLVPIQNIVMLSVVHAECHKYVLYTVCLNAEC
jgi:hypothetical protein